MTGEEEPMRDSRGYAGALFDFSFTQFVTTRVLRILYGVAIAAWAVGSLVILAGALNGPALVALAALVFVPIGFCIAVTLTRIWCELVIVAFRLADHVAETAEQTAAIAVNTAGSSSRRGQLVT
jgi:uncharacterized protein DUF4282